MGNEDLIRANKDYIESKIVFVKKKFELILSSVKDHAKKESYMKSIQEVDRDLKKLRADLFTESDLKKYEIQIEDIENEIESGRSKFFDYKILRNVNIEKLNNFSNNKEINSIWSYLNFFGKEYLGLLSEQNLPMDFGHGYQRDMFYTLYNQAIRMMENYGNVLEQIDNASKNSDYRERLVNVQIKEYRDTIIKTGKFLHTMKNFIEDVFESEKHGERVLLEPSKPVSIGGVSNINGLPARKALEDLYQFVLEFVDFLKVPDLKKIVEENE